MHIRRSVRRGIVVAAAASGMLALGAGSASAAESGMTRGTHSAQRTIESVVGTVSQSAPDAARDIETDEAKTGNGARRDAGKAIRHVTQEAAEAVSEAPSTPTHKDLGAVSRIPAQAAPSSAPGLPEDLVIEVPEAVPGVSSIGILPLSLPALPVTPGIPSF